MNPRMYLSALAALISVSALSFGNRSCAQEFEHKIFELRVYHVHPEGRQQFHQLMANPGMAYMSKHGMALLGVWVPVDDRDTRVFCLISHDDVDEVAPNWKSMASDREWNQERHTRAVALQTRLFHRLQEEKALDRERSHDVHTVALRRPPIATGPMVEWVDHVVLDQTPFSPQIQSNHVGNRIFELRTNVAQPNRLVCLNARFDNHTSDLLRRHGFQEIGYWNVHSIETRSSQAVIDLLNCTTKPARQNPGCPSLARAASESMLVYMVAHESIEQAEKAHYNFRRDPEWARAYSDSELVAGGCLTEENGATSCYLRPASYSPIQ